MKIRRACGTILFILLGMISLQTACTPLIDMGSTHTSGIDSLVLEFYSNRSWLKVGESVHLDFTVTNTGKRFIVVESKDKPVLDIIVQDMPSRQVLLSWAAQNPDKALHRVEWQPGESKAMELVWTAPQEEYGRLIFLGGLLNENSKIAQSANVSIYVGVTHP